jgi:hypothetical protein
MRRLLILFTLLVSVSPADAQTTETGSPAPIRRWDVSAGVGVRAFDASDLGDSYSSWNGVWQPRVQLGRYLTPHLKVEVTVNSPTTYEFYEDEPVVIPGLAAPMFAFAEHRSRLFAVTPLVTYQFLENAFAHPFVSAGIEAGVLDETITRDQQTRRLSGLTYTVPPASRARNAVLVRPVVAAGFKSYFNERIFVRPELNLAFRRSGTAQLNLRLDVGVDF